MNFFLKETNKKELKILTQIKWLYGEYRFYLTFTYIIKKNTYFVIFKKKVVPQIHVCGVTTMHVTPLRKEIILFGLLPIRDAPNDRPVIRIG